MNHITEKQVRYIVSSLVTFLVILSLFFVVKFINETKQSHTAGILIGGPSITVSGEGEVFAVPDVATFTFSVTEEQSTVDAAQEIVTERLDAILAYLDEQGIEEKDVKTLSYNVHPRYEFRQRAAFGGFVPEGERILVGYEVNATVQIKVHETDVAGELIEGVGELGVSNVSSLSFSIDDPDLLEIEAREQAVDAAKEKADALADSLGVRLGRVMRFSESGSPVYFAEERALGLGGEADATAPSLDLPEGESRIVKNVTITYEIR